MKLSTLSGEPCDPDPEIVGLASDSRKVQPGFLFAALYGTQLDGTKYIPQAEEKGAAAILCPPGCKTALPTIVDEDPGKRLASMCARFYGAQPQTAMGITGTNGKTSTASFVAQLLTHLGVRAGSIGTLGASGPGFEKKLIHTTPDPVTMHETLSEMVAAGIESVVIEISSHGLAQHRADGVRFSVAAFSNITQDHLDYHADFAAYFAAKRRLFEELLPPGCPAVVNADGDGADELITALSARGIKVLTTGQKGQFLTLQSVQPTAHGLSIVVEHAGRSWTVELPLIGLFQAENALLAAGIVIALGSEAGRVLPLLARLCGAPGRMERVSADEEGRAVYIDYAHTPDAMARAIDAIRPHTKGRLIVVFGAGGDRDAAKRPLMGLAAQAADVAIVTDDNPRSENPADIRRAILQALPEALEVADREEAIAQGAAMLGPGDVLLVAGKGHETGQIVGDTIIAFDDAVAAKAAFARHFQQSERPAVGAGRDGGGVGRSLGDE